MGQSSIPIFNQVRLWIFRCADKLFGLVANAPRGNYLGSSSRCGQGLPLEGVCGGIPDKQLYHGGVELPAVLQLPHPDFP